MRSNRLIFCIIAIITIPLSASGIDATINATIQPITNALSSFIFYEIKIFETSMPLIVLWLISAAIFFTVYFKFLNLRGFKHAFELLRGDYTKSDNEGELTHFQALSTAVSGTVGIGNIAGVAIVISIGGPGATFWLVIAGFLACQQNLQNVWQVLCTEKLILMEVFQVDPCIIWRLDYIKKIYHGLLNQWVYFTQWLLSLDV